MSYYGSAKTKVFISFDYDNDNDLKNLLVGQSRNDDTPFEIIDHSVKQELSGDWKEKVRTRIRKVEQVIIICGQHMNTASGVNIEIGIALDEGIPYFLLRGRSNKDCVKPECAKSSDKVYKWTWGNLKDLIGGAR